MAAPQDEEHKPRAGDQVDVAAFGRLCYWTGASPTECQTHDLERQQGLILPVQDSTTGAWSVGVEWGEPRDVARVEVRFRERPCGAVLVQYWQNAWPSRDPDLLPGARRGWLPQDDPWHGNWRTMRGSECWDGNRYGLLCDPLDVVEMGVEAAAWLAESDGFQAGFRRTLKLRLLVHQTGAPQVEQVLAYSEATWREGSIDLLLSGAPSDRLPPGISGCINGYLLSQEPLMPADLPAACGRGGSVFQEQDAVVAFRARVLYSGSRQDRRTDDTVLTVRSGGRLLSLRVPDLDEGPVRIPDLNACAAWTPSIPPCSDRVPAAGPSLPIYSRVDAESEQTWGRATMELPRLDPAAHQPLPRYLPIGLDEGWQTFGVRYDGAIFADRTLLQLVGRQPARLFWPGSGMCFEFASGNPPRRPKDNDVHQSSLDGWLPVYTTRWLDREVVYEQTVFAAPIHDYAPPDTRSPEGDEVVAMARFVFRNFSSEPRSARLWLSVTPEESWRVADGRVFAAGRLVGGLSPGRSLRCQRYQQPRLRCALVSGCAHCLREVAWNPSGEGPSSFMTGALYDVELQAGGRHALALVFPFSTPMDREAEAAVCALRYDEKAAEVVSYWRAHLQACASLSVPEAALAGMARAAIVHVAIGARTERESGLTVLPAATWGYAACGNEASWQVELLDRVGRHDRAERYLTTFLKTQGQGRPEGRFTSPRGSFQARNVEGADGDGNPILGKGFGYNLDHGAIMAALANHYWLTGDRDWLARVSPHLVEACEFVTRERRQTMVLRDGQPAMEWGLLPAGRLEDNREWAHWFAVNAQAYRGMAALADVLAEIEHPQASALQVGAEEYRQDIRRAVRRATESSPVVRLRDGTFIPHVPSRTGLLGRDLGWFREAAYGALQLLECGVIAGNEPEATWILQDLEDNVFPSREWGRVVDLEEYWFSRSGMTIQPFLTSLGIDYLRRGQVKHGLRALFNSIAASLYDDVPVFAEHAVTQLGVGQGPFYKAPDECRAVLWLLTFLVDDEGDTLWLAPGAPRAWYVPGSRFGIDGVVTKYGPVTYHVACASTSTQVSVRCPERHRPQDMRMRLRLPGGALVRNVLVNGHRHDDYSPAEEYIRIPTREAHVHVTVEHDPIA